MIKQWTTAVFLRTFFSSQLSVFFGFGFGWFFAVTPVISIGLFLTWIPDSLYYIIPIYIYITRNQMTLVLEGWPSKIELSWLLGIYIYMHAYTPISCAYTKVNNPIFISYQNIQIALWLCSFLWSSILRESESSLAGCLPHWGDECFGNTITYMTCRININRIHM